MNAISATNLPVIKHNHIPVITTEVLARLYDVKPITIRQNFSNNADRFIEGKHYFKLEGNELKDFKNRVDIIYSVDCHDKISLVAKRARSLTLWTERGSARHAKLITSDQAWEVFEKLEDFYFANKTSSTDRTPLRQACEKLSAGNMLMSDVYRLIWDRFNVSDIDQIPANLLPEAVAFVYDMILARQRGANYDTEYLHKMYGMGSSKVEANYEALKRIKKALTELEHGIQEVEKNNATNYSVFESLMCQTPRGIKTT